MEEKLETTVSSIHFSKEISDEIIRKTLSENNISWQEQESLLDKIIPGLVNFGYYNISGIKARLDRAKVNISDIDNFSDYEKRFPSISSFDMTALGQQNFELAKNGLYLTLNSNDMAVLNEFVLREDFGDSRKTKRNSMIKINMTKADMRASAISLIGYLSKQDIPDKILINQKFEANTGDYLFRHIIKPSLDFLNIETVYLNESDDISQLISSDKVALFQPTQKYQIKAITDFSDLGLIISADNSPHTQNNKTIGDYVEHHGVFPNLGFNFVFPTFLRPIDSNGIIQRSKDNTPDLSQRGKLLLDRFFSAYELQTNSTLIKNNLEQIMDYFRLSGFKEIDIQKYMKELVPGSNQVLEILENISQSNNINVKKPVSEKEINFIYSKVLADYYKTSVRLGVPSSTWLLKLELPYACKIDYNGVRQSKIPLSDEREGYILAKDLKVKYPPNKTLYTSQNIIGRENFPITIPSPVNKRIKDSLDGKNLFGFDTEGYLFSAPVVSPGDFDSMLNSANRFSAHSNSLESITLDDIVSIMDKLHKSVEKELENHYNQKDSMITVFGEKTKIPISEIESMVKRARLDFIDNNGLGLKKLAYSAFVDSKANFDKMNEEELSKGIKTLSEKTPNSPFFMVTPGNITLYDSFCLFSNVLMARIPEQKESAFTLYFRPSESDVTFNYLAYHFHKLSKEIDPENKKGLQTLIQKAYWDPDHDDNFLIDAMANAKAGIYYGTAKTYKEARIKAALKKAEKEGFSRLEIDVLDKNILDNKLVIGETLIAKDESAKSGLVDYVNNFIEEHKIYPETLNATVILEDAQSIDECAKTVISQTISLRGADCTNCGKVWVSKNDYEAFMNAIKKYASELNVGDTFNPNTNLAQYESDYLKGTEGIIKSRNDTIIIPPKDASSGKIMSPAINPKKNYTGVIVTEIKANSLIDGDPMDKDTYLKHLSSDMPLPWINVIVYESKNQILESMQNILQKYSKRTNYPRYLYVAAMGGTSVSDFEKTLNERSMVDLFKKGEEAHRQFLYYRPHQGSFFINDLVK